jgi:cellulose synthase operon protein YhjQ
MPLVCFASPKGGTGCTMLTASVGVALHRAGWRVLAIDCDRQNALRLNFELPDEMRGIADTIAGAADWNELAVATPAGISLIPFGATTPVEAMQVNYHVGQNPDWLRERLAPFMAQRDLVVLVDMPPGPSAFHVVLDSLATMHVVSLLADAMSLAVLPKLRQGDYLLTTAAARTPQIGYVLNQVDPRRQLCRDVLALSRDVLGDALYGMIHQDEGIAEAAACQLTVLDYAPESAATHDIAAIAQRVHDSLASA